MKKILVFSIVAFISLSFSNKRSVTIHESRYTKDTGHSTPAICGSYLDVSNSVNNPYGIGNYNIYKVKFTNVVNPSNDVWSREITTSLGSGEPDITLGFGAGTYDISVTLYEDIHPFPSCYLVLKDYQGNVIGCHEILFGTNAYNFSSIYGGCTAFSMYISNGSC